MPARIAHRLAALVAALAVAGTASAATHHVHADGSGGYPTIQSAIVACLAGDTVLVHPGTYRGPGNRGLDFHGVDLVLLSSDGPEVTILDGEQQDRLVYLHSGESGAATIEGFTVQNGHMEETYAGGIHCVYASMTLKNCIVQGCSATGSGGIAIGYSDSPSELINVLVRDNIAGGGGGIQVYQADVMLRDVALVNNSAGHGGGVKCGASNLTMENVVFEGNYGPNWGGGLYTAQDAIVTGHDVLFLNNVGGDGGGLYALASVTLEDASFVGNTGAWGGGLYAKYDDVTVTITRGLFAGNVASQGGGILCQGYADLSLTECTLTGNVSTFYWGAGMHFQGAGDVVIANTIVAFNGQGGGIYNYGQPIELSCCDVYGNEDGDYLGYIEDPTGTAGNISVDPLFCGDLAPEAPYSLRADSDCAPGGTSCGQIGAFGVGCTVTAASPRTWTRVKSLY